MIELKDKSTKVLLATYAAILEVLRDRGMLRTSNNPVADYAEYLACRALSLTLARNSEKGYDAIDGKSVKYQIKARRVAKGSKPTRFSAIRNLEENRFDFLIAVMFKHDFGVEKAFIVPKKSVKKMAFWQAHVNGWILPINDLLWNDKNSRDVTKKFRKVQLRNGSWI